MGAEVAEVVDVRMGREGRVGIGGGTGRCRCAFGLLVSVVVPLAPPLSLSLPLSRSRSRSPSPSLSLARLLPGLLLFDLLRSLASFCSENLASARRRSESFVDTTVSSRGSRSSVNVPCEAVDTIT